MLLFVLPLGLLSHKCGFHALQQAEVSLPTRSPLAAIAPTPFRAINVVFDTANVDSASVDAGYKNLIKGLLLPRLSSWTASYIQVNGPTSIPAFQGNPCSQSLTVAANYSAGATAADLLIFATAESNSAVSYVASATYCALNSYNNRPNIGYIRFNAYYMPLQEQSFDLYVRISMHELFHVLVLNPSLYDTYPNYPAAGSAYYSVGTRYYLRTAGLLAFARAHLNCSGLMGVPMEDQGSNASAGAHFEKAVFGEEMMTAEISAEMPLTGLMTGLLNDCGWYQAADVAEQLWWGKNEGCAFVTSLCSGTFPEFCAQSGAAVCTGDSRSGSVCSGDAFTNGCLVAELNMNYFCDQLYSNATILAAGYELKGPGSRCFVVAGSTQAFGCFPSACNADGSVALTVKGANYTCSATGQVLSTGGYSVTCPDLARFCALRAINRCAADCGGRGYCLAGGAGCNCRYGYGGSGCAVVSLCSANSTALCQSILSSAAARAPRLLLLLALLLLLG